MTDRAFDEYEYTKRDIMYELYAIQKHASDGSALDMHCSCIQEKHLIGLKGASVEAQAVAKDETEKKFYQWLPTWADNMINHVYDVLGRNSRPEEEAMYRDLSAYARELRHEVDYNSFKIPKTAHILIGVTDEETEDKDLQKILKKCIREGNPMAICQARLE